MSKVNESASRKSGRACAAVQPRSPSVADIRSTFVINGRVASKSIADPDMAALVQAAAKRMFASKDEAREYFLKRGAKHKDKSPA